MSDLLGYITLDSSVSDMDIFDSKMLIEVVEANLQVRICETQATIKKENLPKIYCNRTFITQLFQNLIGNAIKFCKDSPCINISCRGN